MNATKRTVLAVFSGVGKLEGIFQNSYHIDKVLQAGTKPKKFAASTSKYLKGEICSIGGYHVIEIDVSNRSICDQSVFAEANKLYAILIKKSAIRKLSRNDIILKLSEIDADKIEEILKKYE